MLPQSGVPKPPLPCTCRAHVSSCMYAHPDTRARSAPAPCTHVCNYTPGKPHTCGAAHLGSHTCTIPRVDPAGPPSPPPRRGLGPLGSPAPAAPHCSVAVATLQIYQWRHCGNALGEAGGRAVLWELAGDRRTDGWLQGAGVQDGLSHLQSDAHACVGVHCAHVCEGSCK